MSRFKEAVEEILTGISDAMGQVDQVEIEEFIEALIRAKKAAKMILLVGAGRSSLVGRAFAMRLMHLGFNVFVMGETINPAVTEGDIVLIISGSGSTTLPVTAARMAKKIGVKVLAVTSNPVSPLGKIADLKVVIHGRSIVDREDEYVSRQLLGEHESLTPMGTLFENSCMVFLDGLIANLMDRLRVSEDEMKRRHTVIE